MLRGRGVRREEKPLGNGEKVIGKSPYYRNLTTYVTASPMLGECPLVSGAPFRNREGVVST